MEPPTLFGSDIRQRLLCVLALHGPTHIRFAMTAAGRKWIDSWASLEVAGLIVSEKKDRRTRIVAIAESFPAHEELLRLLRHLATHYELAAPQRDGSEMIGQSLRPNGRLKLDAMLGWPDRLLVFLALEALGGSSSLSELSTALPDVASDVIRHNLARFQKRGVFERVDKGKRSRVRFSLTSCCVAHMRPMLGRLLGTFSWIQESAMEARKEARKAKYRSVGKINWRRGAKKSGRSLSYVPSTTDAPLLFATDSRFRVLTGVAHCGPMTARELRRVAQKPHEGVLGLLVRDGFLVATGSGRARTYALHPRFPARNEMRALLRKLWTMHPGSQTAAAPATREASSDLKWSGNPENIFGSKPRTLPLLTIASLGAVDGASLARLVPQHDQGCLRNALAMYERQGILKTDPEGNARMYSLNPSYGAFDELRALLARLVHVWPEYAADRPLEEALMSGNRLVMRRNSTTVATSKAVRRSA